MASDAAKIAEQIMYRLDAQMSHAAIVDGLKAIEEALDAYAAARVVEARAQERERASRIVTESATFADEQGDQEYGDSLRLLARALSEQEQP